jgi:hypothetical protein
MFSEVLYTDSEEIRTTISASQQHTQLQVTSVKLFSEHYDIVEEQVFLGK